MRTIFLCVVLFACSEVRPKVYPSATISYGEAFFLNECARCHGDKGEGNPKKDIPRLRNQKYVFEELKYQMNNPEGIMPEFIDVPDSIIHQMVLYLEKN